MPVVNAIIDAAVPFRGETARGYVEGTHALYQQNLRKASNLPPPSSQIKVEARALFNQDFRSIYAMVPGDIMLLLMLIPSMLTALSVVREKELGSIANFYAAPASRLEFLLGQQLPYLTVALVEFTTLVALAILLFQVPLKGSLLTLAWSAVSSYVSATTGFGLLISVFSSSQTAAIFAAAIIAILPAVQFSGMFVPVSSLSRRCMAGRKDIPEHLFPGHQRRYLHQGAGICLAVAQRGVARDPYHCLLRFLRAAAEEAGEIAREEFPPHHTARNQGADESGPGSGAAVSHRLFVHVLGVHTGKKRGHGRHQCLCGVVDEDDSSASRQIRDSLLPPLFRPPGSLAYSEINRAMNEGEYTFIIDIPSRFQSDLSKDAKPTVEIVTDATAMSQAGRGPGYISQIITREVQPFWSGSGSRKAGIW